MAVDALPPLYAFVDDNHASWVVIFSIVFYIYSLMAVAAKIFIRFHLLTLQSYDFALILGMICLFVQTAVVITACNSGLGRHFDSLSVDELIRYQKLEYASLLFSVVINGAAKISICLLINAISCFEGKVLLASRLMFGTIITWVVSGLFLYAFQCPMPVPWATILDASVCPRREPVIFFNVAMNMTTDLGLCALPIAMMWNIQTTFTKKMQIIALFGSRIIVPMTTIPIIVSITSTAGGSDMSWNAIAPTIWLQVSLNLSVISACIPSLKPVLDSFLGQTIGASIQPPYRLTRTEDDGTTLPDGSARPGGRRARALDSDSRGSWFEMRSPRRLLTDPKRTRSRDDSESTRNLTDAGTRATSQPECQ